jgi:cytochrome c oxidase cbb3-type subunit 4
MMKFAKNYLQDIEGIASYPMFSLVLFFVFFVLLFAWVMTASKQHISDMAHMPLEDTDHNQPFTQNKL